MKYLVIHNLFAVKYLQIIKRFDVHVAAWTPSLRMKICTSFEIRFSDNKGIPSFLDFFIGKSDPSSF